MAVRKITFDIETSNEFTGGSWSPTDLDLSVVCIHDSKTDAFSSYTQDDLHRLWPILEQADILIGYNSDHFDIPILDKYYPGDLTRIKSIDLLKEIRAVLGRRLKMDSVAQATLGVGKSADGLQAIKWWKEGKKDLVIQYCLDDVKITKELYDYARKNNALKYADYDGEREIKLNTREWERNAISVLTHTLPF